VRAEDHGIVERLHANISCAPSFMSVFAHFLLLDYVQEVIAFSSNVPPSSVRTLFKPGPICLKLATKIYLIHS
jgi:hypothetical protein